MADILSIYAQCDQHGKVLYIGYGGKSRLYQQGCLCSNVGKKLGYKPVVKILARCRTKSVAIILESKFIALYEPTHNKARQGCNGGIPGKFRGHKHTLETRNKMSQSRQGNKNTLGHKLSKEHKAKISQSLIGNKHTAGHKLSADHVAALRAGHQRYFHGR